MTPREVERKRDLIAALTPGELRGWHAYIFRRPNREPFEGELSALMERARQLKIELKG